MAHVYLLRCSDGSFYTGSTIGPLQMRLDQHATGVKGSYTHLRRPVELVWSHEYPNMGEAYAMERRIHGWSRAKKEALIAGDFGALHALARRRRTPRKSRDGGDRTED